MSSIYRDGRLKKLLVNQDDWMNFLSDNGIRVPPVTEPDSYPCLVTYIDVKALDGKLIGGFVYPSDFADNQK